MNVSEADNTRTPASKVLVLGATGATGRLIVSQALARGHDVTALVRSPDKGSDLEGAKRIVGDARDKSAAQGPRWAGRRRQCTGHTG